MKNQYLPGLITGFLLLILTSTSSFAQTSWKGVTSTNWATATNWTAGVPLATTDVIIGDANFTGAFQPAISATAAAKTLLIGGAVTAQLTVASTLTVKGDININSNGTLINGSASVSLTGNWTNNGSYTTTSTNSTVIFNGAAQSIGGTVTTTFRKLTINAGSVVMLTSNIVSSGASSLLTVSGTLNPNESPSYLVSADNLTVSTAGILKVNAGTFAANYVIATAFLLNAGSIVDYSATATNQTISSAYTYSTLRVSGAGTVKSLAADLPALLSTSSGVGYITVLSGTLDVGTYLANRGSTVAGGTLSVSNGAFLKVGGSNNFPSGYTTNTLSLTSTVEYNGGSQTVSSKTYGNLLLTSSGGTAIKTMPATAFTVAGSLTSAVGLGTAVSFAAASNISVTGALNIGASTTFDGATFSHAITGSFNNNGTFTPSTSTITLKGAGTVISGNAVQNFYNLTITASVTAPGITSLNIAGNLLTSGSGAFTQAAPGVLTMTGTTKTVVGTNLLLNNLSITGVVTTSSTATITGDINVTGSFIASAGIITMNGSGKTIINSGTLTFKGLVTSGTITSASSFGISSSLANSGSFSATAGTVTFSGTSLLSGTVGLYNVTINGTSLGLASNAVLGIANLFTITTGSLNVTSYIPNTVNYNGAIAQTIKGTTYNNLILSNGNTKTAGAIITVNNTLTIAASTTFDASTFTHTVLGNWVNNGTFTAGSSTVQFTGTANASLSGASVFNKLTVNKSATSVVSLLNNTSVGTITMTAGVLNTGSNTLTVTTTVACTAGVILGTITRNHAFIAGTAYQFEGLNNTITFAGVTGINSVTVNTTVGNVTDFPYNGAIGRYYTITIPSGTYTTATLRLHYEDAELNGNDESVMQLWRYNGAAWGVAGKTANSTTSNYVEKSGLTNLTNRWSLTDDGSVLSWNGSISNDWSTGGNWTLVQGTFTGAPTSTDIAQVGVSTFVNQPVITTAATVKSLTLGSAQAVTLTLNTGGSLVANGNISGTWSTGAIHTINTNAQAVTVNGDMLLSDNVSGHAINLNVGTGTVSVLGSLTESGNANIGFTGTGTLNIGKDFIYTNGVFTPGTGLVKYNGTVSQIVAGVPYNNVTIAKTAGTIATLSNPTAFAGNLVVTTGEFDIQNPVSITGSVSISSGGILDANATTLNVGGSWTQTGVFNAGTGTVIFNGSGTQTISAAAFNILTFNKPAGTATLSGNNTVSGDLSLLSGTLNLSTYTLNQSSAGDVFTIADGTTLLVSGANNFPTNFTTYTIGTNSLVHYNGAVAQSVAGITYGNLSFSGGGSLEKTFLASSTINGNIVINSGATVNSGNFVMTLNGNWTNSGTFTPGTGDILLNGTAKTLTGNTTFYDVTVNGSYTVATSNMTFNGLFLVTSSGSYGAGSGVATVNGDLTNSGTLTSIGTTTFSGTTLQTIRLVNAIVSTSTGIINFNGNVSPVFNSTTTPTFATLNINNTAGVSPSVNWLVQVAFNVSSGAIFNGGISRHRFNGSFTNNGTVTSSGTLNFVPTSAVTLQLSGTTFSSTGMVIFGGSGAVTITGVPTQLQDVNIANTNAAGITPSSAWTINGKFSINNDAIFNAGSYAHTAAGDIESNGILNGNTSTFTMSSGSGQLSGSPGTVFHHFTVTGSVTSNSDFSVDGDFMNNGTYDGSLGALIMTGNNAATIGGTTTPSTIAQLSINKTANATVTANVNINALSALLINSGTFFTSTYTIAQSGAGGYIVIAGGATLKLGGTNTVPAFSLYNFDVASTVDYAGTAQTIANSTIYGNVLISAAGNKTAISAFPIIVAGNFTITAGNFVANNNTHKIAGNWVMTGGTFNNTNSTIQLNGTADQSIQTIAPFNSLNVNKASGLVKLSTDITVGAILSFTKANIQTASYKVISPAGGSVTGAAQNAGWVNGNLQKNVATGTSVTRTFEVGDSSYYSPATLLLASVSTAGNVTANAIATDHPNLSGSGIRTDRSVNRYWTLLNSGTSFTTASLTVNWVASDLDASTTPANFKVGKYNMPSWTLTTVAAPTSTSIQTTGLTSLGDFAIGEQCSLTAAFSYSGTPYCSNAGIAVVTVAGTAGTFTSTTGLVIDATTGAVDLAASTPGIYTVTNSATSAGGCTSSATATITITSAPSAAISYSGNPFCLNSGTAATVTRTGTAGGTYSSTAGLVIDVSTGAITLATSTAGTYLVTYSIAAAGECGSYATTTSVTITAPPSATISYSGSPYCSSVGTAPATRTGTAGGTYSSSPSGASIDASTGTVNLAASSAGIYTITYTVAASGGCSVYTTTTTLNISPNTWTGTISTDWNTAGNWSGNAVPTTSCPDVTILSGTPYQPTLNYGIAGIQNLIINTGATLTISNATLQLSGTLNNSGTLIASNGSVKLNGATAQVIPAAAFQNNALYNLIISNTSTAGVTLGGALDIYNSLIYTGTGKKLNTADMLTLKSTALKTAWIGDMTGNTIIGKVTVERYITAKRAWRLLSVPTNSSQTIKEAWQENAVAQNDNPAPGFGTQITGAGGTPAGFDAYTAGPSIKTYNPVTGSWDASAATTANIKNTTGYMTFVRGDRTVIVSGTTPTPTVMRTKGDLYTGTQPAINIGASKFATIGNPYASTVDMRNISQTGLKEFFYLWDPNMSGTYGLGGYQTFSLNDGDYVVTPGGGSYGAPGSISNYIQSGLAFFVQATPAGGSLTFTEASKSGGSAQAARLTGAARDQLRANMYGVNTDSSSYMVDGIFINYDDAYSNAVDDMDALKSLNGNENLSIKTAGTLLVVERRHTIMDKDTVFLNISGLRAQSYKFEFTSVFTQPGMTGFLEDNYLGTRTALNPDAVTGVSFSVTNIAGSYAANRFRIVYKTVGVLPLTFTSVKAYQVQKAIQVEWQTQNESGMKAYEVERSADGNRFTKANTTSAANTPINNYGWTDENVSEGYHYYRIKSIDVNGKVAYSQVVKVWIASAKQSITVYPNPVKDNIINLQLNNQPTGEYGVRLLNNNAQVIISKNIQHADGNSTQKIDVPKNVAHGIYQLEIIKAGSNKANIQVIL